MGNIKSSVITVPPEGSDISGTFVANTTAIKGVFQRISAQFAKMYKKKAFLHWYKGEGMDEMEFQEADKNVRDLITEYQDKQDAGVDLEEDEDDEDGDEDEDEDEDGDEDGDEEEEEDEDFKLRTHSRDWKAFSFFLYIKIHTLRTFCLFVSIFIVFVGVGIIFCVTDFF